MNRACLFVLVAFAAIIASPTALHAQVSSPAATPTPDPQVFEDEAMHFRAPSGYYLLGQQHITVAKLTGDAQIVAGWIHPDRDHPRRIAIQMEYYEGNAGGFDGTIEGQMRDQFETAIFKNKKSTTLKNGMPAVFMEMTSGSGFNVQKFYILLWADGQRGVAIILQAQLGDISTETAEQTISDASAVRYPVGRE
jgi:hypothetical protein